MKNKLQTIAVLVFIVAIAALAIYEGMGTRVKGAPLEVGMAAPDFQLTDTNGKLWRLTDLKGKVVFINFWATWCPSCTEELPSINNLNLMAGGADDFKVLTVLYNDSPEKATQYFKERDFSAMPILVDRGGVAYGQYGLTGIPETFIIDKKGVLRFHHIGPRQFDKPDMITLINGFLDEPEQGQE